MRLAEMQRALRDAIVRPETVGPTRDPEVDAYLEAVVSSGRLGVLVHVRRSWRAFDLGRACPLTVAALRTRGLWERALDSEVSAGTSAFIERLSTRFLEVQAENADGLVSSVARFEAAYQAVQRGSEERFVVGWDRDPLETLSQLLHGGCPSDVEPNAGRYVSIVARGLPNCFTVVREE